MQMADHMSTEACVFW